MLRYITALFVCLFVCCPSVHAHEQDAQVQGQVLDSSGASIPKAIVRVVDLKTGAEAKTDTRDNGQYLVLALAPGEYRIFVQASGFSTAASEPITLAAGQHAVMNFTLTIGTASADIVVTAEKRDERLMEVPGPVTVLEPQALADTSQVLVQDYATSIPGVHVSPNEINAQVLSIRGITTGGYTNPTVSVTIDGIPFTGSTSNGNQLPDIDPGDLERIEVLRGPQGTLYGAASLGGLINYITKDPSLAGFSGRFSAGTSTVTNGAEPGFDLRGAVNIPLSGTFAIRASGFTRQDSGYIDNSTLNISGLNKAEAYGGRLVGLWAPSSRFALKFNALYQHTTGDGSSDRVAGPQDFQQHFIAGVGGYGQALQSYSTAVTYNWSSLTVSSLTAYNRTNTHDSFDFSFIMRERTQKAFNVSGTPYFIGGYFDKFVHDTRLSTRLGRRVELLAGAFYTKENNPGTQVMSASDPATGQIVGEWWRYHAVNTYDEYAGYADLTYRLTDRFDIQIGGRESHHIVGAGVTTQSGPYSESPTPIVTPAKSATANAFTYLATARYKLSPTVMAYGRFASGYRPGGPNPVQPETPASYGFDTTKNYEVGLKGTFFDRRLTLDGSLYDITWDDIQLQTRNSAGFTYTTNGSGAKSQGVELAMSATPWAGMAVSGWIDYDDAVLTQSLPGGEHAPLFGRPGDRLPDSSRFSSYLTANQDVPLGGQLTAFGGVTVNYIGDRKSVFTATPQREAFPAYTKTDLRAGIRHGAWTLSAYVNNVGDVHGILNGGVGYYYPFVYVYIKPRTAGLTVAKLF